MSSAALQIGRDFALLYSRAQVLQLAGLKEVKSCLLSRWTTEFLAGHFDLVLLCHTLPERDRESIARVFTPGTRHRGRPHRPVPRTRCSRHGRHPELRARPSGKGSAATAPQPNGGLNQQCTLPDISSGGGARLYSVTARASRGVILTLSKGKGEAEGRRILPMMPRHLEDNRRRCNYIGRRRLIAATTSRPQSTRIASMAFLP